MSVFQHTIKVLLRTRCYASRPVDDATEGSLCGEEQRNLAKRWASLASLCRVKGSDLEWHFYVGSASGYWFSFIEH